MKKSLFLLFGAAIVITNKSSAQVTQILNAVKPAKAFEGTPILDKKASVFSVGFGIPNNTNTLLNGGGLFLGGSSQKKQGFGPIFLNYEYFIKKEFSLGIGLLYATGKQDFNSAIIPILGLGGENIGTSSINLFQITGFVSYHLYTTDKIDPYIKGGVGINLWKTKYISSSQGGLSQTSSITAPTPFGYQGIVGLRYFVSKKFAPYGEIGFTSLKFSANLGLSVKL